MIALLLFFLSHSLWAMTDNSGDHNSDESCRETLVDLVDLDRPVMIPSDQVHSFDHSTPGRTIVTVRPSSARPDSSPETPQSYTASNALDPELMTAPTLPNLRAIRPPSMPTMPAIPAVRAPRVPRTSSSQLLTTVTPPLLNTTTTTTTSTPVSDMQRLNPLHQQVEPYFDGDSGSIIVPSARGKIGTVAVEFRQIYFNPKSHASTSPQAPYTTNKTHLLVSLAPGFRSSLPPQDASIALQLQWIVGMQQYLRNHITRLSGLLRNRVSFLVIESDPSTLARGELIQRQNLSSLTPPLSLGQYLRYTGSSLIVEAFLQFMQSIQPAAQEVLAHRYGYLGPALSLGVELENVSVIVDRNTLEVTQFIITRWW